MVQYSKWAEEDEYGDSDKNHRPVYVHFRPAISAEVQPDDETKQKGKQARDLEHVSVGKFESHAQLLTSESCLQSMWWRVSNSNTKA